MVENLNLISLRSASDRDDSILSHMVVQREVHFACHFVSMSNPFKHLLSIQLNELNVNYFLRPMLYLETSVH